MDSSQFPLPPEVLAFLIRTLAPRDLWQWLQQDEQFALHAKVTRGFRATPEVLRQSAARARLVAHLQTSASDCDAILELWQQSAPRVLDEVRTLDESTLISELGALQEKHGVEGLLLALYVEEKEEALEAWTENIEDESFTASSEAASESHDETDQSAEIEKLKKQCARESKKADHWKTKFKEAQARAARSEKSLRDKASESERLAREATRTLKAEANRSEALEAALREAENARDRAERRARSTQAELEQVQSEIKTARRQAQRLQKINEELRGQVTFLTELQNRPTEIAPALPTPAPSSTAVTQATKHPTGAAALWNEKEVQKIKAAIDRNDEAFVTTLRRELKTLRERDAAAYKKLLQRVRKLGSGYDRVLTSPTARVLVDASNVARHEAGHKGRLEYLLALREELRNCEFFPILFVADASLPHFINEPKKLRELIARGEIEITASGQQADEVLARRARETGAYVVTNDRNFHFAFTPDFAPARIGFQIEGGVVLLEEF